MNLTDRSTGFKSLTELQSDTLRDNMHGLICHILFFSVGGLFWKQVRNSSNSVNSLFGHSFILSV